MYVQDPVVDEARMETLAIVVAEALNEDVVCELIARIARGTDLYEDCGHIACYLIVLKNSDVEEQLYLSNPQRGEMGDFLRLAEAVRCFVLPAFCAYHDVVSPGERVRRLIAEQPRFTLTSDAVSGDELAQRRAAHVATTSGNLVNVDVTVAV